MPICKLQRKKVYKQGPVDHIQKTLFFKTEHNKLECNITPGRKGLPMTNTSLFGPVVSYEEKKFF